MHIPMILGFLTPATCQVIIITIHAIHVIHTLVGKISLLPLGSGQSDTLTWMERNVQTLSHRKHEHIFIKLVLIPILV